MQAHLNLTRNEKKYSLQEIDGFLILTISKLWEKVEIYG